MTFRSRAMEWEETVHEAGREKVADPAFAPPPTLTRNQSLPDRNSPAGHDQAVYQAPSAGDVEMPNIVYVLTNPAMPGLVKIGMTDRDDVKRRMSDLYTTGVPLPFECVAAREIEDREAADIAHCECGKQPKHQGKRCCCCQGSGSRVQLYHDGGHYCAVPSVCR